ncbi:hypothetical protein AFLA_002668 [Aspergillus flavus NRRL3357]|nr:hypothetical protein AFLA_002668 [Aspergillus flavus NRRL3357]
MRRQRYSQTVMAPLRKFPYAVRNIDHPFNRTSLTYFGCQTLFCLVDDKSGALHVERGVSHAGVTEIEMVLKKQICDFFFSFQIWYQLRGDAHLPLSINGLPQSRVRDLALIT